MANLQEFIKKEITKLHKKTLLENKKAKIEKQLNELKTTQQKQDSNKSK